MTSAFDWSQFEEVLPEKVSSKEPSPQESQPQDQSEFDWGKFEEAKAPEKEESISESAQRHAVRTGSRVAEAIAGLPGDVAGFLKHMILEYPVLTGPIGYAASKVSPETHKSVIESIPLPPGSQDLQQISEEVTGGYTSPKSENEKRSDEVFQDLTLLFMPVKGKLPSFAKTIGTEVAAQLSKEGVKMLGGGDTSQALAKAAAMFTGGMLRQPQAMEYAEGLYKKADSLLPVGASVNATKMEKELGSLVKSLEKGVETTDKKQVIKPAKELMAKVKDGLINVDELSSAKRDINKLRGDPETVKGAKKLLSSIGKQVDHAIEGYSSQNPEYVKAFKNANEAWGTIAQSRKFSNMIKNSSTKTKVGSAILGLFESHNVGVVPSAAAVGAGYGILKSSELTYRILKSPTLRKHYGEVVRAGLQENGPAIAKSLKGLDAALLKEDKR